MRTNLFIGDKKVIEYVFRKGSLLKVKEIMTPHKKSIFGLAVLDERTLVSSGLDGKLMVHYIEHSSPLSPARKQ